MNTIFLSEDTRTNKAYYITSITEEDKVDLLKAKASSLPKQQEEGFNQFFIKVGVHPTNILKLGKTSEISTASLSPHVGWFRGKDTKNNQGLGDVGANRELHYRDYLITQKEQERMAWIVNRGQDLRISVSSAVKKMNGDYTILWALNADTSNSIELKQKFENNIIWKLKNL